MKLNVSTIGLVLFALLIPISARSSNVIKVGILLPLSGPLKDAGHTNLRGHQYAVYEINQLGGVHSIGGAKFQLVVGDTQGDVDIGKREAERLINNENVVALIGAYQTTVTYRTSEVSEKQRVPYIISTALSDILTQRGQKYVFRTEPNLTQFVQAQFQFLETNNLAEDKKIALVYEKTLWGQSSAHLQRTYADRRHYKIVSDLSYSYTSNKLKDEMKKIAAELKKTNPDVILQTSYLNDSIEFSKALKAAVVNPMAIVATGAGPKDPAYVKTLRSDANFWFVVNEWNKDLLMEGTNELNKKFHKFTGYDMNGISAVSYVATWILKEALEKSKSTNREKVRNAISGLNITSGPPTILPMGKVFFDRNGNNIAFPVITQIRDGSHKSVWPPELSATRPIFGKYFKD